MKSEIKKRCEYTSHDAYNPKRQYIWFLCVLYMMFYETIEMVDVHHVMCNASLVSICCFMPILMPYENLDMMKF